MTAAVWVVERKAGPNGSVWRPMGGTGFLCRYEGIAAQERLCLRMRGDKFRTVKYVREEPKP